VTKDCLKAELRTRTVATEVSEGTEKMLVVSECLEFKVRKTDEFAHLDAHLANRYSTTTFV
jgi:hypothetical protein